MPQAMLQALLPKQCTYGRTDGRTSILAFRFAWLLKKLGCFSAADVTYLTRRSHKMPYKHFNEYDAPHLIKLIQRRRPTWNPIGIGEALRKAAERDWTLGQITSAAENAALDKEGAKTPEAMLFDKYQQAATKAKIIAEKMLCVECTPARKHPVNEMTKMGHGYVCGGHGEEGSK